MPSGRVLATQQARDAAKQLLALTGTVKDKVGKVVQQGGVLADPHRWDGGVAGKWRSDWGRDASQLNQTAAKLDELERRAHQVVEDIFTADSGSGSALPGVDLPLSNIDGEQSGGVNPNLPTDLPTLQKELDAARAAGIDPQRYKALLEQYWLVKAANDAGIDLNKWDPSTGVDGNLQNIRNVYTFYGKLFGDHPDLQWAGMANMIGPSFAAGFMDLDSMQKLAGGLGHVVDSLPPGLRNALPPEVTELAKVSDLSANEFGWYENKFLAMQKHIFMDMAAQHEAYLNGGTPAIDEMHRAGLIDDRAQNAWKDIASGDPSRIQHGNTDLLYREQNQIIAKQYDQMYQHDGPVGPAMTYLMTTAGAASIPGTKTPGEYKPLTVGGDVTIPGLVVDETVGAHLKTPLPDFNVADQDARWDYITHDTLPAYQKLLHDHPEQAHQIIASPVQDRISQQRLSHRWPKIAEDVLTDWRLSMDARLRFHWPWS